MAERVTTEDVAAEQHHVDGKHEGAKTDPEAIVQTRMPSGIVDQEAPDQIGEAQKVAGGNSA